MYIAPGDLNAKNIDIGLGDTGLEVERETFLSYNDIDDCRLCYGV